MVVDLTAQCYILYTMANELTVDTGSDEQSRSRKLSPVEWLIVVECVVGVVLAIYLVIDATGVPLWSEHAAEVLAESWSSTATIGLIVAIAVSIGVGVFVWFLAKSTLLSDSVEE